MKIKKIYKWIFALILAVIIVVFGFTFTVKEGSCAIVSRFGEVRAIYMDSGLHFKLPYPFENVYTYDTRSQYMDSGYTETLTNDKKNVILQTYLVWHIEDPRKFYNSVGDNDKAEKYLNDLTANVKNGVMGNYELSALVSTDLENIKIDEISEKIEKSVSVNALKDYGIKIEKIKIKFQGGTPVHVGTINASNAPGKASPYNISAIHSFGLIVYAMQKNILIPHK